MITIVIAAPMINSNNYSILSQCFYDSALGMSVKWGWVCTCAICPYECAIFSLFVLPHSLSESASLFHCLTMNSHTYTHSLTVRLYLLSVQSSLSFQTKRYLFVFCFCLQLVFAARTEADSRFRYLKQFGHYYWHFSEQSLLIYFALTALFESHGESRR